MSQSAVVVKNWIIIYTQTPIKYRRPCPEIVLFTDRCMSFTTSSITLNNIICSLSPTGYIINKKKIKTRTIILFYSNTTLLMAYLYLFLLLYSVQWGNISGRGVRETWDMLAVLNKKKKKKRILGLWNGIYWRRKKTSPSHHPLAATGKNRHILRGRREIFTCLTLKKTRTRIIQMHIYLPMCTRIIRRGLVTKWFPLRWKRGV